MPKYLTPAVVRVLGTGLPLTTVSDLDLVALIAEAEGAIDAHMGFDDASGLGFAAGPHDETHVWNPNTRRIYPWCRPVPVQSVSSFAVQTSQQSGTGAPVQATVDPTTVKINNDDGYLETVSLVVLFGLLPAFTAFSLTEALVNVTYQAGYSIAKTQRPLYSADRQTYHSLLPAWDSTVTPSVYVGGTLQNSGYTVNGADGSVTFATPQQAGASVTATFNHTIPEVVITACKGALVEAAGQYFANLQGMAGMSAVQLGGRRSVRATSGDGGGWRATLDGLKAPRLA